jgi:hypothetical protein
VALYALFTVPLGSDAVVIANGAACTLKVVLPLMLPCLAEMVVAPAETAVAKPDEALIVAMAGTDDVQPTCVVMFCVLPSEYVPVAVNCRVVPTALVGFTGVTAIEVKLGGGAAINTTSTQ